MQLELQTRGQSVTHGSGPSSSPTISTSTNRITALGGSNYYYDSNGSLTQDDLFKYKYDAENRVVEIRNLSDTLLSSYAYDGNSMQVIKVAGGTRTWFLYAGGQLVSEYYDAASNTYSSPTSPGSAPADTASTLLYQHADHLTTRVTTDNAGTLSNQQAHYPYGENWYATGTADPSVKRKFTSYRKETDSSLASGQINYAIARYHGARIGRFHRPDPVRGNFRNPQRLNRYAYVTNNPVRYTDPRGLDMVDPANAEGFWGGMGGDRNPYPVINYSSGEGFALGSLHYRGMNEFSQEAYAAYVANIEAVWQDTRSGGDNGSSGNSVNYTWGFMAGQDPPPCPLSVGVQFEYDQCVKNERFLFALRTGAAGLGSGTAVAEFGLGAIAGVTAIVLGGPVGAAVGVAVILITGYEAADAITEADKLKEQALEQLERGLHNCYKRYPTAVPHRGNCTK